MISKPHGCGVTLFGLLALGVPERVGVDTLARI
jgi:hypothetical protein